MAPRFVFLVQHLGYIKFSFLRMCAETMSERSGYIKPPSLNLWLMGIFSLSIEAGFASRICSGRCDGNRKEFCFRDFPIVVTRDAAPRKCLIVLHVVTVAFFRHSF